jgi:hypothetical protein
LTTSLLGLHKRSFVQRKPGALFPRVGALQKSVALLKLLAIPLCNAYRLRRISTSEQKTAAQVIALKAAGCRGRVASGDHSPEAPTDPDMQISRIRLFGPRLCYATVEERMRGCGSG